MENLGETVNRYKRARALADMFKKFGFTELNLEPEPHQLEAARLAMDWKNPPSVETWCLAAYLLEEGR